MFEDIGDQSLKNIARPVRVYRVRLATAENTTKVTPTESGPALTRPDKPSIAVMPFQNMSGDRDQDYFADGMVEEIITALSRIRWLFVIARNSSYGPALAVAAFCHCQLDLNGWAEDQEANRRKAVDFAQQAARNAAGDSRVLAFAALVLGYFGEDIGAAMGMIDRSLALNP